MSFVYRLDAGDTSIPTAQLELVKMQNTKGLRTFIKMMRSWRWGDENSSSKAAQGDLEDPVFVFWENQSKGTCLWQFSLIARVQSRILRIVQFIKQSLREGADVTVAWRKQGKKNVPMLEKSYSMKHWARISLPHSVFSERLGRKVLIERIVHALVAYGQAKSLVRERMHPQMQTVLVVQNLNVTFVQSGTLIGVGEEGDTLRRVVDRPFEVAEGVEYAKRISASVPGMIMEHEIRTQAPRYFCPKTVIQKFAYFYAQILTFNPKRAKAPEERKEESKAEKTPKSTFSSRRFVGIQSLNVGRQSHSDDT
ncbi:uncharacterized protein EV420DRAFT_1482149 [Desarmillaria tabescens]|uniref:Uncharacterized protein n=1 Tax=Armillaria tabescens TaxID=1929756 RepID=A0AA39N0G4_ARMTA|nr:uncharacterized protein EV420DRAFT_1482149 [Desarmillaria tabescens]KAK0452854.1 hypothetical protein EV420DRAFT_1482149 [Desarmillaria tabescens]